MQRPATLAEVKAGLAARPEHVFHSSLSLYIIAENCPRPDCPEWVEVGCLNKNGAEGMVVYLSPLDALLDAKGRNRDGGNYCVHPFEAIDPRPYVANHNGWFTLYLVYGFAARGKHLLVSERGDAQALTLDMHYQIPPDMSDHFHLLFTDKVLWQINAVHRLAGLHDYGRVVDELAECSSQDLGQQTQEAANRIGQPVTGDDERVSHCALYDPVEQRWQFAAFADLRD